MRSGESLKRKLEEGGEEEIGQEVKRRRRDDASRVSPQDDQEEKEEKEEKKEPLSHVTKAVLDEITRLRHAPHDEQLVILDHLSTQRFDNIDLVIDRYATLLFKHLEIQSDRYGAAFQPHKDKFIYLLKIMLTQFTEQEISAFRRMEKSKAILLLLFKTHFYNSVLVEDVAHTIFSGIDFSQHENVFELFDVLKDGSIPFPSSYLRTLMQYPRFDLKTIPQYVTHNMCKARKQTTDFIDSLHYAGYSFTSSVSEEGYNLLEYCLLDYLAPDKHLSKRKVKQKEPLKVFVTLAQADFGYRQRGLVMNGEQLTVQALIERHQAALPRFYAWMREQEAKEEARKARGVQNARYAAQMVEIRRAQQATIAQIRGLPAPVGPVAPLPAPVLAQRPAVLPAPAQRVPAAPRLAERRAMHQDSQNTHNKNIHRTVSESAVRLLDHYFPDKATRQAEIQSTAREFHRYLKDKACDALRARATAYFSTLISDATVLHQVVEHEVENFASLLNHENKAILNNKTIFFGVAEEKITQALYYFYFGIASKFVDPASRISFPGTFLLVWKALNDVTLFPTQEDQESEKRLYVDCLAKMKNETIFPDGTTKPGCASGGVNANIIFLWKKSPIVEIVILAKSTIFDFIKDFLEDAFSELSEEDRQHILISTTPEKKYNHQAWQAFVQSQRQPYIDSIREEIEKGYVTEKEADTVFQSLIEEDKTEPEGTLPLIINIKKPSPLRLQSVFPLPVPGEPAPAAQPEPLPRPPQYD